MTADDSQVDIQGAYCPIPLQQKSTIVMGHGSGGKMMHDLIAEVFVSAFDNPILATAGSTRASISIAAWAS